ncbi:hypothetical protein BST61_g3061 [Cercospora zeina]
MSFPRLLIALSGLYAVAYSYIYCEYVHDIYPRASLPNHCDIHTIGGLPRGHYACSPGQSQCQEACLEQGCFTVSQDPPCIWEPLPDGGVTDNCYCSGFGGYWAKQCHIP